MDKIKIKIENSIYNENEITYNDEEFNIYTLGWAFDTPNRIAPKLDKKCEIDALKNDNKTYIFLGHSTSNGMESVLKSLKVDYKLLDFTTFRAASFNPYEYLKNECEIINFNKFLIDKIFNVELEYKDGINNLLNFLSIYLLLKGRKYINFLDIHSLLKHGTIVIKEKRNFLDFFYREIENETEYSVCYKLFKEQPVTKQQTCIQKLLMYIDPLMLAMQRNDYGLEKRDCKVYLLTVPSVIMPEDKTIISIIDIFLYVFIREIESKEERNLENLKSKLKIHIKNA